MSYRSVRDLKDILFLVTATYTAYRAYSLLCEQERKSAARKRRRLQLLKQSYDEDSTSSDEKEDLELSRRLLNSPETMEITREAPQPGCSIERMKITNPRTVKRMRLSGDISGAFADSFASKLSDKQFKKHFRVSRETMGKLHDRFVSSDEYKNIFKLGDKTRIPAKYYMMMFLWFTGKRCSSLDLSRVFNVPLSRSWSTVDTVTQFFVNSARDRIRFPDSPSDKRVCAEHFQEIAGFPDVIGCLVNGYIEARAPLQDSKNSSSANSSVTATIQAICDCKGRFLDVFIDVSRKAHHTEMLQASPIAERLKEICQGRYHILADGEYHVREWLLTPFKEPIQGGQAVFNQKHSSTLAAVSDSLDGLQRRFQQLTSMTSFSPCKVKRLVIACCVLQNMCLDEDDRLDERDPLVVTASVVGEEVEVVGNVVADDSHLRRIGELKRRQIIEKFKMK